MVKLIVFSALLVLLFVGCSAVSPPALLSASPIPAQNFSSTAALPLKSATPSQSSSTATAPAGTTAIPLPPPVPDGWPTYTWADLGLAIDFPPGWSVSLLPGGPTFTSPQGPAVQLNRVDAAGLTPEAWLAANDLPNTRCSTIQNGYGVTGRTCFDTISRTTSAKLVVTPTQGEAIFLGLAASRGSDGDMMQKMIESIRVTR